MNKEMTKGKNKEKLKEKSIDIEKYKANLPKFLKEQIAKYETIFDHNPIEDEIKSSTFGLFADFDDEVLNQLNKDNFNQERHFYEIYELYLERDDKKNTDKYLKKLPKERQERINSPFPHPIFDKVVMN